MWLCVRRVWLSRSRRPLPGCGRATGTAIPLMRAVSSLLLYSYHQAHRGRIFCLASWCLLSDLLPSLTVAFLLERRGTATPGRRTHRSLLVSSYIQARWFILAPGSLAFLCLLLDALPLHATAFLLEL
jgi:hypothetical protein